MAGGWPLGRGAANSQNYGSVTASTTLTSITTGATNTKGNYTQLVASTASDSNGLLVLVSGANATGTALSVDIGVGAAASEKIIVPDVALQTDATSEFYFPVSIAAGSRIAAKAQSTASADTARVAVITFADGWCSDQTCSVVDCLGFTAGTSKGVILDAGTSANTKSAYSQIIASTAVDYSGLVICLANPTTTTAALLLADVAVGGLGSEKVIVSNLFVRNTSSGATFPSPFPFIAGPVAAGSRIAVSVQCNLTTSPSRTLLCTIYGIRT